MVAEEHDEVLAVAGAVAIVSVRAKAIATTQRARRAVSGMGCLQVMVGPGSSRDPEQVSSSRSRPGALALVLVHPLVGERKGLLERDRLARQEYGSERARE